MQQKDKDSEHAGFMPEISKISNLSIKKVGSSYTPD